MRERPAEPGDPAPSRQPRRRWRCEAPARGEYDHAGDHRATRPSASGWRVPREFPRREPALRAAAESAAATSSARAFRKSRLVPRKSDERRKGRQQNQRQSWPFGLAPMSQQTEHDASARGAGERQEFSRSACVETRVKRVSTAGSRGGIFRFRNWMWKAFDRVRACPAAMALAVTR